MKHVREVKHVGEVKHVREVKHVGGMKHVREVKQVSGSISQADPDHLLWPLRHL